MPFLFQQSLNVQVTISYEDSPQDVVKLPQDLWDTLLLYEEPLESRLAVTLSRTTPNESRAQGLNELTVWATNSDDSAVIVPRSWTDQYPHIFHTDDSQLKDSHSLSPAPPIAARSVVLQPATTTVTKEDGARFVEWLSSSKTIVQAGSVVHWPQSIGGGENTSNLRFKVKMMEPAASGYIERNSTRVVLVHSSDSHRPQVNGVHSDHVTPSSDEEADSESLYDIDERFLSNMVDSRVNTGTQHTKFRLAPETYLQDPQDISVRVRTTDLSTIGVLDGDWVLARAESGNARLVRLFAEDALDITSRTACASPATIFNLSKEDAHRDTQEVTFHPTPFGSRRPAVPTATTVTIARVASPISTNRVYQPYFLRPLQKYFERHPRLVKKGDIIALPLDTDESRYSHQSEDQPWATKVTVGFDSSDSLASANEVAYFTVTNLEHEVMHTETTNGDDILAGCIMGEYGCWVDTSVTRMVQAGVEHSRIPDVLFSLAISRNSRPVLSSGYKKLLALASAALTRNAVDFDLQISVILKGARGTGKMTTISHIARTLNLHVVEVNCYGLIGDNDIQTEGTLRARFERAATCSPCLLVLRHIDALSQTTQGSEPGKANVIADVITACIGELRQAWRLSGFPVLVLATTDYPEQTAPALVACFKHEISFEAPDEAQRSSVLEALLEGVEVAPDVSVGDLATQTAALVASDLADLVERGEYNHAKKLATFKDMRNVDLLVHAGSLLTASDLDVALNNARASYSESIGAPKIPTVSWDDVGGLANVKKDILDTVQLPLEHPELFSAGLKKRSGILLYGPPGTGKTLLAKAVATSCNLNFFSVKGPELLNMYIGESEANVRRVFQRARDAKPCVIFFDELDSVAPKRGNHGDSGGVMDRIVSQLLAELDGVAGGESGADVFVIGATNRPDLLDPALLRPGRFDRMLYLGVSQTHEAQLNILQALTRKFKLHPDLDLRNVAESCPFHYTGADFYALCSDALLKAMSRKAEEVEAKIAKLNTEPPDPIHPYPLTPQYYLAEMATPEDIDVLVQEEDFKAALRSLVPSVSQAEMDHYARVQHQFSRETINSVDKTED